MAAIFQVDAFTDRLFGGNPAAVVPLESWVDDQTLQSVAAENNLAETAFIVAAENGYELRWFTPAVEVALCGHATLAAAHVLMNTLKLVDDSVDFHTRVSGTLTVKRQADGRLLMSFPSIPVSESSDAALVTKALSAAPASLYSGNYSENEYDYVAVFRTAEEIAAIEPELSACKALSSRGVIVTAIGRDCDFVSRYFAPNSGIDEDPVTGSAHCLLAPYWASELGKEQLIAKQISSRGGVLECKVESNRTLLIGSCVDYLHGEIKLV